MSYQFDNLTLHTDAYEINMMQTFFQSGMQNRRAVFEVYFRKMPFENGFAIFAGLEKIVHYINNLNFTDDDIEFLRSQNEYTEDFLEYLRNFKFRGTIRSFREGELAFNNEPLIQVEGNVCECQLV